MARLGIFGGTFNPIHYGHLRAAEEVREELALDKVLFIPTGNPPLKSMDIAPAGQRLEMAALVVRGNPSFDVLSIECEEKTTSFTVNTVEKLKAIYPEDEMFFIIGLDAFTDLELWYRPERLTALINFVVISRPGNDYAGLFKCPYITEGDLEQREFEIYALRRGVARRLDMKLKTGRDLVLLRITGFEVSSSLIRRLFREGRSIRYLLPEIVESYIISNGLYRER